MRETNRKPMLRHDSGEIFVSWLTKKELTTEQFSRQTGIHTSTVDKWRTGAEPREPFRKQVKEIYSDFPI